MGEHAPEANGAPAPEEQAAPEPQAPAEPWEGPTREQWEQSQQFIQAAGPILGEIQRAMDYQQQAYQQQQGYPQQPPPPEPKPSYDPFDPNSVEQFIDYKIQQGNQQYENLSQLMMADYGERLANQELERLQGELGEFDREEALMLAAGMLGESGDPGQAMRAAAEFSRAREAAIRADERQRHGIQMQNLNEAPRESTANQGAMQEAEQVPRGRDRYEQVVERWKSRQGVRFPT